ncbi:hypothetical protein GE061_007185 [Apolygus lucorum]|uniref:Uncharacterized protein n=1 Tax=Apolygus lucorum TaxID=248454 RepID=A0A6A4J9S7_APOLU|nr:hypothetical protein GE061_007185 [Apolygus lucorum]
MAKNYHLETLISPGASEEDGCFEFLDNFEKAYTPPGSIGPPFHLGTLADAIKSAWARPAPEVKLLVLYLHREGNPLSRRFTRIFLSGVVSKLLTTYCVLWGWDLTSELNEKTLLRVVSNNLGYDNAWRLQMVGKMMYPCFIFLSRTHRKPGVELVQFLKASADLSFSVTLFSNAVVTFSTKIKPQLVAKEEKNKVRSDGAVRIDTVRTIPNDVETRHQGRPKTPTERDRRLSRGKPPLVGDESLRDGGETLQSIADKMMGKAVDISGLFDVNSSQNTSSYHSQDEAAKKRLAELKKQYLEAEYERLKAEKKAIFTRLLQEDLSKNKAGPSGKAGEKSDGGSKSEDKDWEIRKKLKHREKSPVDHKIRHSPKSTSRRADDNTITLRFRSYKEMFEKKFKTEDTFEKLLLFLTAKGYSFREFKILAGWPRVDISEEDSRTPLKNLNFNMRDNVILERRKTTYRSNT